ncbi:hypothetical protein AX774_g2698 [Zancudomyces culisetae]|uniref:Uncharacterized protein n=1 Tax=Zancudomyces culisetae TaxID=1213189 RepID=A0A1R1PSC3_ZANCU|nr:hypothetical protein AX774_g2698 [Zancudomyces culisetae]|eukprot:OMH83793.1 hypothetical protein AX774_g2698 [Zancudomyces culisetae]
MLNSVGSHQSIKVRVLEGTIGDLREDMFNGDTIDENKGTVKLTPLAPIIHNSHPQVLDSSSSFRFPLPGLIRDGEENSSTTSLLEKDQQKTEPDSQSGPSNPPMSVKK